MACNSFPKPPSTRSIPANTHPRRWRRSSKSRGTRSPGNNILDFLTCRHFRRTLLCRQEIALDYQLQPNVTADVLRHGVIQGYNAQALVDEKHQNIVHGAPSGCGQDHRRLAPMLAGATEMLELAGLGKELPLAGVTLSADSNYHGEANLQACEERGVDGYIPDNQLRSRDSRFATQERHNSAFRGSHPGARYAPQRGTFGIEHFTYHSETRPTSAREGGN